MVRLNAAAVREPRVRCVPTHLHMLLLLAISSGPTRLAAESIPDTCDEPCGLHGTCFLGTCWCEPHWKSGPSGQCSIAPENKQLLCSEKPPFDDTCMEYAQGWGRLQVSSAARYRQAQNCELGFWQRTKVPMRNAIQAHMFRRFETLPRHLGHVLELGAGPYTKLRLILEEGEQPRTVDTITLLDPLAFTYMTDPKVLVSYPGSRFCLNQTAGFAGGCIPTLIGTFGAEIVLQAAAYDTIIMVNTIEHCQNALVIFENIRRSLKPGGHLVLAEEFSPDSSTYKKQTNTSANLGNALTQRQVRPAKTNICHPLRITARFYDMFLNAVFRGNIKHMVQCGNVIPPHTLPNICNLPRGPSYRIASAMFNTIYAIAQKEHVSSSFPGASR